MATVMPLLALLLAAARRLVPLLRYRTEGEEVTAPLPTAAAPSRSEQPVTAGKPAWAAALAVVRASFPDGASIRRAIEVIEHETHL